jgi:hypothetical protein
LEHITDLFIIRICAAISSARTFIADKLRKPRHALLRLEQKLEQVLVRVFAVSDRTSLLCELLLRADLIRQLTAATFACSEGSAKLLFGRLKTRLTRLAGAKTGTCPFALIALLP